jgi:hypothetical protein
MLLETRSDFRVTKGCLRLMIVMNRLMIGETIGGGIIGVRIFEAIHSMVTTGQGWDNWDDFVNVILFLLLTTLTLALAAVTSTSELRPCGNQILEG